MADNLEERHRGARNELIAVVWLLQQGYDVFRNVSMHGAVDLVGLKDGEVLLFDVKKSSYQNDGSITRPKLTQEQKSLGVKCLCVFDDGSCLVDERDRFEGDPIFRICNGCGEQFQREAGQKRVFCSRCKPRPK